MYQFMHYSHSDSFIRSYVCTWSCIISTTGSGLAISYPYFHKIESGAMLMVKGRISVFCYCSSCPQSSFGWRYGNLTGVPESPLPFELKAKNNTNEYILSTNQYSFSLLNKGLYICDLGTSQNKLEVTLNPRSGNIQRIWNGSSVHTYIILTYVQYTGFITTLVYSALQ